MVHQPHTRAMEIEMLKPLHNCRSSVSRCGSHFDPTRPATHMVTLSAIHNRAATVMERSPGADPYE